MTTDGATAGRVRTEWTAAWVSTSSAAVKPTMIKRPSVIGYLAEIDLPDGRNADRPPQCADRGDRGGQDERAVVARALDDDASDDRPGDPRQVADRILDPDPGTRRPRPGDHLRDRLEVQRQRGRRRAGEAQEESDGDRAMGEGEAEDRDRREQLARDHHPAAAQGLRSAGPGPPCLLYTSD